MMHTCSDGPYRMLCLLLRRPDSRQSAWNEAIYPFSLRSLLLVIKIVICAALLKCNRGLSGGMAHSLLGRQLGVKVTVTEFWLRK